MGKPIVRSLAFAMLASIACQAAAQQVSLAGTMGGKALLVIDGGAPRMVAPGQSVAGVKLLSLEQDVAVIEVGGKRSRLRMGESQVSVGSSGGSGKQVTLVADVRGHFLTQGSINGANVGFLVDTGASTVAMGASLAKRIGIDYTKGEPGLSGTANGVVQVWRVRLSRVTLGEITLHNVEGTVLPNDMPYVLLGMSFLNRMEMRRDGSTMVLNQRY